MLAPWGPQLPVDSTVQQDSRAPVHFLLPQFGMRRTHLKSLFIVCAVLVLGGCSAIPTVEYTKIHSASDLKGDEIDTFSLQDSAIIIDSVPASKDAAAGSTIEYTVTSKPIEYADYKVGIRKADTWGVSTNLNITKIDNSSLIKEIGVEVVDSRADWIGKIGGAIVSLVPLIGLDATFNPSALPQTIKPGVLLQSNAVQRDSKADIDAGNGVKIDFGLIPVDAVEASAVTFPAKMSAVYYSACRSATVKFTTANKTANKTVMISDPRYFQKVAFPKSGKVSFHSECGVSTQANKDSGDNAGIAIVQALATQGKAIKDAIDSAKKK
jgi:hypothetical protein